MLAPAGGVFVFFMPYTMIWAWREVRQHFKNLRENSKAPANGLQIESFSRGKGWAHTFLIICFMALSVSGLAWVYMETGLGKALALPVTTHKLAVGSYVQNNYFGFVL